VENVKDAAGAVPFDRSALSLSGAIRRREISCVDVVTAHLDRIDAIDGTFHALLSRRPRDEIVAEATERDSELDRGMWRGWMHGLPHAVKDLSDVRGLPTTLGFRSVSETPAAADDDPFVSRIRDAGAVFIGKSNTPEFGLGSHTYNKIGATTANVADPTLSAGGSSGGAAVAVGTGMVPVADGSDFMGSLRNPPGWNGVIGLRPTPGLVLGRGESSTSPLMGVDGPIARSVADLAALLATMAEPGGFTSQNRKEGAALRRVAWLGDLGGYLPFENGILDVCQDAVARWAPKVESVSLSGVGTFTANDQLWPTWIALRHHESGGWLAATFDEDDIALMKPEAQWELEGFRALSARQLDHARLVRRDIKRSVFALLDEFDLLALPTAQCWPFPITEHWPSSVAGKAMDTYHRWMEVTTLATLAGCPALAVPAGVNEAGLHMGLQLIGRPGCEMDLLSWAEQAERRSVFTVSPPSKVAMSFSHLGV
jgi:amidase